MSIEHCDVSPLTNFESCLDSIAAPSSAAGPDLQALWSKSPMHAAVAKQYHPSASSASMPNLVAQWIGPEAHQRAAFQFEHPFNEDPRLELELRFAVQAYANLGPRVKECRETRWKMLRKVPRQRGAWTTSCAASGTCGSEMPLG